MTGWAQERLVRRGGRHATGPSRSCRRGPRRGPHVRRVRRRWTASLLTGGADLDLPRYGQALDGSGTSNRIAMPRGRGVVRGVRRSCRCSACAAASRPINVFSGGTLLQHVDGHVGAAWGSGPASTHPLRLVSGTALAGIVAADGARGELVPPPGHPAVGPGARARRLGAGRTVPPADSSKALEAADGRFMVGQCHPERQESTPEAFERLFAAFVAACRTVSAGG